MIDDFRKSKRGSECVLKLMNDEVYLPIHTHLPIFILIDVVLSKYLLPYILFPNYKL